MTYADFEGSIDDGEIIELYRFVTTSADYRYTSYARSLTFGADLYLTTQIKRSSFENKSSSNLKPVEIEMSISNAFIQEQAFDIPDKDIDCEVYRVHTPTGTPQLVWKGRVGTITVSDRIAKVRIPSAFQSALDQPVPSVFFQTQCNHRLYDSRCALAATSFRVITTPNTVSLNVVTVDSTDSQPNGTFKAGEIVRVLDGERRLITDQIGNVLTLNYPFKTLGVGDSVEIYYGCDRSDVTCRDKFSNIINFGGFNIIPNVNIFEEGLK